MDTPDLPDLAACLEASTWRHLLALMSCHGLPCSTRWHKADLVQALHAHLSDPTVLRRIVLSLAEPAHTALVALLQAGGALPATRFTATFGDVRPYRPWRKESSEEPPWRNPASPAERLWYLGLLYFQPPAPTSGVTQRAVIPAGLLAPLQHLLLTPQAGQPIRLRARPGHPADLAWHVALLLASLEEEPVRPLSEHWLPPNTLLALANRMGLDQSEDFRPSRSERRLPYPAFVHYLAEAAGLAAGQQRLGLTPLAWQWLAADTATRWQMLWQAWRAAPSELAAPYRFPWANLTPEARSLVLTEVSRLPLDRFTPLAQMVEQAHLHDERRLLAQPWGVTEEVVAALITGPLFWFGIVDVASQRVSESANPWPDRQDRQRVSELTSFDVMMDEGDDEDQGARSRDREHVSPSLPVRLTLAGGWLLGLPDCGPPPFAAPQPCTVRLSDPDLLLVPPTAQPIHLARLAPLCQWLPLEPSAPEQRLLLAAERVGQAAARGVDPAQMTYYLEQALGRPASRRQQQRLRQWAGAGQQVRVRHLTVLETTDPALMGQLRSRKLVRRHLGEALSPTRSALNPAGLPALLQHLRTLGLYAAVEGSGGAEEPCAVRQGSRGEPLDTPVPTQAAARLPAEAPVHLETADAGLLWMAGLVYVGLGAHVPLQTPLSSAILDALAEQLSPAQREAAEHAARQVLEQVESTLRGYLGLPAWQVQIEIEEIVPVIETALANRQDLLLTYWGAGREQPVVRRVTPYWLERRGGVLYLIAYCHLRDEERVFRVDRIVECQVHQPTASANSRSSPKLRNNSLISAGPE